MKLEKHNWKLLVLLLIAFGIFILITTTLVMENRCADKEPEIKYLIKTMTAASDCVKPEKCPNLACNCPECNIIEQKASCPEPRKYDCKGAYAFNAGVKQVEVTCSDGTIKYWDCLLGGWK